MSNMKSFPEIGMSPSVWGPIIWHSMHIVSLGYSNAPSNEEKQAAIHYYESLIYMIPCPICREHYKMFLANYPVKDAVANRDKLIHWVFMIHNKVNEQLGKPVITLEQYISKIVEMSEQSTLSLSYEKSIYYSPSLIGLGVLVGLVIGGSVFLL